MSLISRRPTYQDLTWFLDHRRTQQLDLDPAYQRRSVWTKKDRLFFLDTILHGFPSPAIFLHKTISDEGVATYHVVDGKQRLETVFQFVDDKIRIGDDFGDVRFAGKRWSELSPEDRRPLWNYPVPVEFVDFTDTTLVKEVFDRLNRNVKKLNPQELRHARFTGWFAQTVEEKVASPAWRELGLVTPARERRMADAQFISELLILTLLREIQGFDQASLDEHYAALDNYDQDPDTDEEHNYVSPDEFQESYDSTLDFLKAVAQADPRILTHIKTFTNLYTLWGVLTLHRNLLGTPAQIAGSYSTFMAGVIDTQTPAPVQTDETIEGRLRQAIASYRSHSRGPSTDLPQRRARHEALQEALQVRQ